MVVRLALKEQGVDVTRRGSAVDAQGSKYNEREVSVHNSRSVTGTPDQRMLSGLWVSLDAKK
jgi:hypothetical protein